MNYEEKILTTEEIYNGRVINVKLHDIELHDGSKSKREIVEHTGGVGVIALTEDKEVFMVTQYRIAAQQMMLEIPAGKLEKGEDPKSAGLRELQEETGYKANNIQYLGVYYATPGYCQEKLHIYLATDLEFVGQNLDEGEYLNVSKHSLDELYQMVMDNKIYDCKTAIAILKAKAILG